jgi:hypothetical protein
MSKLIDLIQKQKHQRSGKEKNEGIPVVNDEGFAIKTVAELSDDELEILSEWAERSYQPGPPAPIMLRGKMKTFGELTAAELWEVRAHLERAGFSYP